MVDWLALRQTVIEDIQHGVTAADTIETVMTGPRSVERMDYPVGQVYPQNTTRSDGNEYTHRIEANLVFERQRGYDYLDDVLHPMAEVIRECMAALAADDAVMTYFPNEIEDFAGQMDNTAVVIVRIEFTVTTLVDFAETGP